MPGKLIKLSEAAEMLGVTTDELVEMRSRAEIHGYRDGTSWKFKLEEVERVAKERGIKLPSAEGEQDGSDLGLIIEGSGLNLVEGGSSSFSALDADLGLTEGGSDLSPTSGSDLVAEPEASLAPEADRAAEDAEIDELLLEPDKEDSDDDIDSILVSEESLGQSGDTTSSTIIGEQEGQPPEDSDIRLASDSSDLQVAGDSSDVQVAGDSSDLEVAGDSSDLKLAVDSSELQLGGDSGIGSDVELVPDAEGSGVNLVAGGSDALSAGSDVLSGDSSSGSSTGGGSSTGSGSDTGKLLVGGSDISLEDEDLELSVDSDLVLGDDAEQTAAVAGEDLAAEGGSGVAELAPESSGAEEASDIDFDELTLESSGAGESALDEKQGEGSSSSDVGAAKGSDFELALEEEEDDIDMLLSGSSAGSDGSLATDSGINLSPTDSGLSLEEEPLDLGGSSVEQLELPEDDETTALSDEEPVDADAATQLKADDEFLLTPVEEAEDESSGSQVIALEDSEEYADEAQTMLSDTLLEEEEGAPALVAEDAGLAVPGAEAFGAPGVTAQPVAVAGAVPTPALPEAEYSIWNVLSLMLIALMLGITGTFMWDLLRNIWEYEQPVSATASLMDTIIKAINLTP